MSKFLSLSIDGLVSGGIFSLFATGLVLTYATSGIFNFAHGAIAFSTALVFFQLNTGLGWPIAPSALASILVFAPLLGLLLERVMFRRLVTAGETPKIVGTVGLSIALPALGIWIIERLITTFKFGLADLQNTGLVSGLGPTPSRQWRLFTGVQISSNQVVVLAAVLVSAVGLWALVARTRLGLQMRAVVDRRGLAQLRGVNPDRTSTASWMLASLLAGIAGVAAGPLFGLVANSFTTFMIVSATAVVIARFHSLLWAVVGGLLVGWAANLVAGYATFADVLPGLRTSAPFAFLFAGLYLLGRSRERAAGSVATEAPPPDHLADLPGWRRGLPWALATAALVIWTLGLIPIGSLEAGRIELGLVIRGLASGLVFLSFVIVTGIGGMVSLAQAAFVTTGALTAGLLLNAGVPWLPAVLLGAAAALGLGAVVAIPALRLGGVALALATLAIAFIGDQTLFQIDSFRNSSFGWDLPRPALGPLDFSDDRSYALLVLVVVGLVVLLIRNLQRSPSGRAMVAVRSAETAASAAGISPVTTKLALFSLSAFVAGLGGVMLATEAGEIRNTSFFAIQGLFWLTITVVFGVRRPGGAILAGMMSQFFPRVLRQGIWFVPGTASTQIPAILFGLGAIQLARNPDGILSLVAEERYKRRQRARQRRAGAEGAPAPTADGDGGVAALRAGPDGVSPVGGAEAHDGVGSDASTRGQDEVDSVAGTGDGGAVVADPRTELGEDTLDAPPLRHGEVDPVVGTGGNGAVVTGPQTRPGETPSMEAPEASRDVAAAQASGDAAPTGRGAPEPPVAVAGAGPVARDALGAGPPPGAAEGGPLALEAAGLRAGYGEIEALHGVDLDVPAGSVTALLGANGAGKSTLCAAIAGLLPAAGSLRFAGEDVTELPAYERARRGLVLAPEARGIFPGLTVEENLALWLADPADRLLVYERFPVLGERRRLPAGHLSGGEQQMLTLAALLARPPRVLVADEPTLGLAPLVVDEVMGVFGELRDRGTTLLLVEEKARDVLGVADHVAFLSLGRVVWAGPASEVDEAAMAERYLGASSTALDSGRA